MSDWAGIKKAINSDLSMPLNEKMDFENKPRFQIFDNITTNKTGVLFSVSNEKGGLVHGLSFPSFNVEGRQRITVKYRIIIDDTEFLNITASYIYNYNSSSALDKMMIAKSQDIYHLEGGYYYIKGLNDTLYKTNIIPFQNNSTIDESTDGIALSRSWGFLISNPIRFERSFSMEIEQSNSDNFGRNGTILYELFD